MGKLDGRVALVTGGARGQGRSHAVALAAEGADVAVCDIASPVPQAPYPMATEADLQETVQLVEKSGRHAIGVQADMRVTDEVLEVVERTLSEFGRIDVLVAQHGIVSYSNIDDMSDDDWNAVIDTNLTSIFKTLRAVIPHMKAARFGRIIVTASMAARQAFPGLPHYVSAKWGLIGLVKACALENVDTGITANVVCPAAVGTDLFLNEPTYQKFCPDLDNPTREQFEQRLFEQNMAFSGWPYLQPEHVSRAVRYFATDLDGVMSGQVFEVGLGMMMRNSA